MLIKTETQLEYNRQWRLNNKEKVKSYNKWYNETHQDKLKALAHTRNTQRITFKGKQLDLDYNPRIGVCSNCGYVGLTHLHHDKYDESDPLKYTRELCVGCHNKERIGMKYNRR